MISETLSPSRPVPMRRSMLHGTPFPDEAPQDFRKKRLVVWVSKRTKILLEPELEWLRLWNQMMWPRPLMTRICVTRTDWSRR